MSADRAQYAVGDWLHLKSNERGEWSLNGEPIATEDVRAVLGFVPQLAPADPTPATVRMNGSALEVWR